MKLFSNLLGIAVAAALGYTAEPNLRYRLTGVMPTAVEMAEKSRVVMNIPDDAPDINPAELLPQRVPLESVPDFGEPATPALPPTVAATSPDTISDKEQVNPVSKSMQMAETEPEDFLEMLRKKVLADLIKEHDKDACASIPKYELFVSKIQNGETRLAAQAMLNELRENYSKTWHLLYPIPLSNRWRGIKGNPVARRDFAEILQMEGVSPSARESINEALEPRDGLTLYGPVNYLDPLQDAVLKLSEEGSGGYKLKSTKATSFYRLESAGFPLATFNFYSYDVDAPRDSVNRVFFMVDRYKRVVAFQEVIESPKTTRLSNHTSERSVYNFLQMRRKGTGSYRIAYGGTRSYSRDGNVCVLTSELIDTKGKPREWVRLHLPRKLAEVCLYICKEERN